MKKQIILFLATFLLLSLTACRSEAVQSPPAHTESEEAETLPGTQAPENPFQPVLPEFAGYTEAQLKAQFTGKSKEELTAAFGEFDIPLYCRHGGIWLAPDTSDVHLAVYFDADGKAELVKTVSRGGVPSLEILMLFDLPEIKSMLLGASEEAVLVSWGRWDGILSGFLGSIWETDAGQLILYYDTDGAVMDVKIIK